MDSTVTGHTVATGDALSPRLSPVEGVVCNPVLRGFNADPSILRVGSDYYLATSTFEWFSGVALYHSRDLTHWRQIGHALTGTKQADLRGVPDSGGIWAPSLSYADGLYWLLYTIVHTSGGAFKDVRNYLITAEQITGPWSDRVYLNASGFDPSLFHDDDGRKWLVNMQWDHRPGNFRFHGIVAQEYDPHHAKLVGPVTHVLRKGDLIVEGPNLYKRNGWYYLMTADGGTSYNHRVAIARSRNLLGPYELDPQPWILTSADAPAATLQKAGHGELVETSTGEWYLAHLASRPIYPYRRCPLGRETSLQKVCWTDDGWLRLASGGTAPEDRVPAPQGIEPAPWPIGTDKDDFDLPELAVAWQTLRVPADPTWVSLAARPGWLRLQGRQSLHSLFEQSLVARRQTSFQCVAETCVEFTPTSYLQAAGLICWYSTSMYYYLRVTHHETLGKVIDIALREDTSYQELNASRLQIAEWSRCFLRATINHDKLQFFASPDGEQWRPVGSSLDAGKLSEDHCGGFVGTFIGMCCQDLAGTGAIADFDYFELRDVAGN